MPTRKKPTRKSAPTPKRRPAPKRSQPKRQVEPRPGEEPAAPQTTEPAGTPAQPIAQLVPITPLNRIRDGYREADVVAIRPAVIGQKHRKQGDVFRIGVIGDGPLPSEVKAA